MTQAINDRRARYTASASQVNFTGDFEIDSNADVAVWQKVLATGVVTKLTLTTDFTVTLDGVAPNTFVATLVVGAAAGDTITVEGETSPARDSDFSTGGDYFAGTVNNAEDRQYRILQELLRNLDRSVIANPVSPATFDPLLPDITGQTLKYVRLNAAETAFEFVSAPVAVGTAIVSDAAPSSLGPVAAGTSADLSRADHVHPAILGEPLDSNGQAINESEGTAVVAAATTNIWVTDGNNLHVTGNTGITSLGTAPRVGAVRWITFDGTPTLTNSADLNLPGGVDFVAAAGDVARVQADTTTQLDVRIFKANGKAVVAFSGNLAFPATQVPSADANTLDDYEEGTWTPQISDGTNDATMATAVGTYVKIGRMVHIKANVGLSSLGSAFGAAEIDDLPFTSANVANTDGVAFMCDATGLAIAAGYSLGGKISPNGNVMGLFVWDNIAGTTPLTAAEISANGAFTLQATYYV